MIMKGSRYHQGIKNAGVTLDGNAGIRDPDRVLRCIARFISATETAVPVEPPSAICMRRFGDIRLFFATDM